MGPIKTHRFADPERFRGLQKTKLDANERRRRSMAAGTGSPRQHLRRIVEDCLQLAGIALILEAGDDAVRARFDEAAAAARQWWTAADTESHDGPRVAALDATVDARGGTSAVVRPQPPLPATAGWMGWTVSDFNMAVDTLIAFGGSGDAQEAGAFPEAAYRSPEVVSENAAFAEVAAKKAWLGGDDEAALVACRRAIDQAQQPLYQTTASGLKALIERDAQRFSAALAETLAAHQAIFSKAGDRADGAYCLRGLMLARVARTYGLEVDDAPYLPVRFLAAGVVR